MLHDADVLAIMPKVAYTHDPALEENYPKEWPAWARMQLTDGREVSAHVRFPKGDPDNPLSWQELIDKYQGLIGAVWESQQGETVKDAVRQLENESNMQDFARLL